MRVEDTERAIRRIAKRKQIEIHTVCPKDDCMIYGDYGRIRQIVLILLDNAVKFSFDKGVIELVLEQNKDGFCIFVFLYYGSRPWAWNISRGTSLYF